MHVIGTLSQGINYLSVNWLDSNQTNELLRRNNDNDCEVTLQKMVEIVSKLKTVMIDVCDKHEFMEAFKESK
jgi:hypothetical protein